MSTPSLKKRARGRRARHRGKGVKKKKKKKNHFGLFYKKVAKHSFANFLDKFPRHRQEIEELARSKGKGWDDFSVDDDVIKQTTEYILFGLNMNLTPPKIQTFCTLEDDGSSLRYKGSTERFVKIGNLISLGTGDATAKGLIGYVEATAEDQHWMPQLIVADIEVSNIASKCAFKSQGFVEWDAKMVETRKRRGRKWVPYEVPNAVEEECVLVIKKVCR